MGAEGAAPQSWLRLALDPPRAWPPLAVTGVVRGSPDDFVVEEQLGFEPDGGAAHRLVRVEKRDANTLYVARCLARLAGVAPADVGFAGLKDRRALATQWFTVPSHAAPLAGVAGDGFRVLEERPHSRKLRRGALAGNRFHLQVRDLAGDVAALDARLRGLAEGGVPNYFGPQRFGTGGANLREVARWAGGGPLPRGRERRAFVLSSARSLVFNAALAARVRDGSWRRLLPGELVALAGSRSVFRAPAIDDALAQRLGTGDVSPSGPLPGTGDLVPEGDARAVEDAATSGFGPLIERLSAAGLRAERRPLVLRPQALSHCEQGGTLKIGFALPAGCFATALLRELLDAEVPEPGE